MLYIVVNPAILDLYPQGSQMIAEDLDNQEVTSSSVAAFQKHSQLTREFEERQSTLSGFRPERWRGSITLSQQVYIVQLHDRMCNDR
jgi:hypothetical protein